ncbi:MAG: DUF4177 domain-containing protein [Rhodobacteraceae bacterium]|nr:DUF4177 domain-containing protein [Paracoccaceae bacterium]QEW21397.1 hypothetical protein LA6_003605 [Marinibacterium anthonyi]
MAHFEYKVVPAPTRGDKVKGVKQPEARFAHSVEAVLNQMAEGGWEFVRAEMLPSEERSGISKTTREWRNLLVFRRERTGAERAEPVFTAAPAARTVPQAEPVMTQGHAADTDAVVAQAPEEAAVENVPAEAPAEGPVDTPADEPKVLRAIEPGPGATPAIKPVDKPVGKPGIKTDGPVLLGRWRDRS